MRNNSQNFALVIFRCFSRITIDEMYFDNPIANEKTNHFNFTCGYQQFIK